MAETATLHRRKHLMSQYHPEGNAKPNQNHTPGGDTPPKPDATMKPGVLNELSAGLVKEFATLVHSSNVLDRVEQFVHESGVAGEGRIIRLLYLSLTSRLLDKPASPVSVAIKGPSSGGKSFLMKSVLRLFPESAFYQRTSVSPKALFYTDESFVHRMLVFEELAGITKEVETILRILLSEGHLVHSTLERMPDGNFEEVTLRKEGPAGLILTTTAAVIHPENETRMLSVWVTDTPAQRRVALRAKARGDEHMNDPMVLIAYQSWLARQPNQVVVPFSEILGELVLPIGERILRDFTKVVSLVAAHALLHQTTRPRDIEGNIVAQIADYEAVYGLVADIISEAAEASIPHSVRRTVEAVKKLIEHHPNGVQQKHIAEALGVGKPTASKFVRSTIDKGYLLNHSDGSSGAYQIVLGEPLPDDVNVLPHPSQIMNGFMVASNSGMVGGDASLDEDSVPEESDQ
jgi:predicted XRE-type DNA-binding protein